MMIAPASIAFCRAHRIQLSADPSASSRRTRRVTGGRLNRWSAGLREAVYGGLGVVGDGQAVAAGGFGPDVSRYRNVDDSAVDYGVSRATAQRAVQVLIVERLVVGQSLLGVFVAERRQHGRYVKRRCGGAR